jgi:acyl-ACP thioesterase
VAGALAKIEEQSERAAKAIRKSFFMRRFFLSWNKQKLIEITGTND